MRTRACEMVHLRANNKSIPYLNALYLYAYSRLQALCEDAINLGW